MQDRLNDPSKRNQPDQIDRLLREVHIGSDEWRAWRAHPVSEIFFQYLQDLRFQIADNIAKEIASGFVPEHSALTVDATQCELLETLSERDFNTAINAFYAPETEENPEPLKGK